MYNLKNVKASVAVKSICELGSFEDLWNRAVVCRLKENIRVVCDKHETMIYEKGDIVALKGYSEGVLIISKETIKKTSSFSYLTFLLSRKGEPRGFANIMNSNTAEFPLLLCSFFEKFEILDNETELLEKHIRIAKEQMETETYRDLAKEVYDAEHSYVNLKKIGSKYRKYRDVKEKLEKLQKDNEIALNEIRRKDGWYE